MRRLFAILCAGLVAATGLTVLAGPASAGAPGPWTVDGQIKIKGVTGFVGDGLFDTPEAIGQRLATAASPAQKAVFVLRSENEKFDKKNRIETWVEYADCDGPGDIALFYQGQNVTEQMFVSDLEVGGVEPGGHVDVRLKVKVAPGASCFVVIGSASDKFEGDADYVIAEVASTQGVPL
jgi:hypothetical protein